MLDGAESKTIAIVQDYCNRRESSGHGCFLISHHPPFLRLTDNAAPLPLRSCLTSAPPVVIDCQPPQDRRGIDAGHSLQSSLHCSGLRHDAPGFVSISLRFPFPPVIKPTMTRAAAWVSRCSRTVFTSLMIGGFLNLACNAR